MQTINDLVKNEVLEHLIISKILYKKYTNIFKLLDLGTMSNKSQINPNLVQAYI